MTVKGYWLLGADGVVATHGTTPKLADRAGPTVAADPRDKVVGMAATPDGRGYWTVSARGVVRAFGIADVLGQPRATQLDSPVVAITATPDGTGYWLLTRSGTVLPYGTAKALPLVGPFPSGASAAVGQAVTSTGRGYWIARADGEMESYGDAATTATAGARTFAMSAPLAMVSSVVAVAASPNGLGYWTVTSAGTVQAYGAVRTYPAAADQPALGRIRAMTSTPDGQGYWLVDTAGRVAAFGSAKTFPATVTSATTKAIALTVPVRTPVGDVPMEWIRVDQRAAATCSGLPWTVLAGIGKVESDFGRSTLPGVRSGANFAGAAGPMQIGIGGLAGDTWSRYSHPVPADMAPNPPDAANPPNPWDRVSAAYAAARYLCAAGGAHRETLRKAVLAYNHVDSYADRVLALADLYSGTSTGNGAGVVRVAQTQLGITYVFGAESPGKAFDCSGLTQWTFRTLGVEIPRTSQAQWAALPHLAANVPWQPGDLVFFAGDDGTRSAPGHVGIYIGNGQMINAPYTGTVVRIDTIPLNDLVGVARVPLPVAATSH